MKLKNLEERARLLHGLAQPNRLQIMRLLFEEPGSVGKLAGLTGISVANASQHLLKLHNLGLVERSIQGKRRIYRTGPATMFGFVRLAVMEIPGGS